MSGLQTLALPARLCHVPRRSALCQICVPELELSCPMLKLIHSQEIQLLKRKENYFKVFSSQRGKLGCLRR